MVAVSVRDIVDDVDAAAFFCWYRDLRSGDVREERSPTTRSRHRLPGRATTRRKED
jgi:hypothetical protein